MKTPEEMAEEYASFAKQYVAESIRKQQMMANDKIAFLAGYKAAQEQYREAVKVLDKHKAAAEKAVTNIKNASDWVTIEGLEGNSLDPIINLPTPAKWISVKDRLPETRVPVLVCNSYGLIFTTRYFNFEQWGYHMITHWMELPEAPKEEK